MKVHHHRAPSSGGDVAACHVVDVALPPPLQKATTCAVAAADGDYRGDGYRGDHGYHHHKSLLLLHMLRLWLPPQQQRPMTTDIHYRL